MSIDRSELKRLAILVVLCGLFGAGVWLPAHMKRETLQQRIAEARQELGMDLSETENLPQLHHRVQRLKQTLAGSQRYVPREDELDQLLRNLTRALQSNAVTEPELVTHETRRFAGYSVVPMTVQFRGSFPATFGVLKQIEAMARLVRIDRLQMEPMEATADAPLLVTVELSTFFAQGDRASDEEEAET